MTPYTKQIVELHKIHKAIENCGCNKDDEQGGGDSGNLLMSLIPSGLPKPDLFLYKRSYEDDNPVDVTNYKIDDLINLAIDEESDISILCLYENSNLSGPITNSIEFALGDNINLSINTVRSNIFNNEIVYNNKTYYAYYQLLI